MFNIFLSQKQITPKPFTKLMMKSLGKKLSSEELSCIQEHSFG